jgi:hypothetical protein
MTVIVCGDSTQAFSTATLRPFSRGSSGVAQERLNVRKIKDLLRLHLMGGMSSRRQLARAVGCSKTAVSDCLRRADVAGLSSWEAIAELDEVELEKQLYPSAREGGAPPRTVQRPLPDWSRVREELSRRDHQVTLALLWQVSRCSLFDGGRSRVFDVVPGTGSGVL